jgi:hypothetical protein
VVIVEDIKSLLISLLKAYNEKQQEVLSAKIAGTARLTRCDGSGACNVYSKESYPNMEDWQRWGNNFAVNIPSICPKAFKKYSEDGIQKASTVADFDFSYQESAKAFSAHVQASMIFRKDNGNWLLSDWTNALK